MKTEKLTKEDVKKLLGAKGRKKFEWSKGDIRKKMSYTYKDNTDEVLCVQGGDMNESGL